MPLTEANWLKVFENRLETLSIKKNQRLLVAWSGGQDSTLLLFLLKKIQKYKIAAAYYNHRLRPDDELEKERAFLESQSAQWEIPLYQGEASPGEIQSMAQKNRGSIEEWARNYRYRFLGEILQKEGFHTVLTGHHSEDTIENSVMNFIRGGSMMAQPSMNYSTVYSFPVVRPLIIFSKEEIQRISEYYELIHSDDSSNRKSDFLRNKVRNELIPQMEKISPQLRKSLTSSLERNDLYRDFIEKEAENLPKKIKNKIISLSWKSYIDLHPALRMEWLYKSIDLILKNSIKGLRIPYRFIKRWIIGKPSFPRKSEGHGILIRRWAGQIEVLPIPTQKKPRKLSLVPEKEIVLEGYQILLTKNPRLGIPVNIENIPLILRNRKAGDVWLRAGYLKKTLARYPREERDDVLLIADGNRIILPLLGDNIVLEKNLKRFKHTAGEEYFLQVKSIDQE